MSARRCIDSQKLKTIWRKEVGMVTIIFIDMNDTWTSRIARRREPRFLELKVQVDSQSKVEDTAMFPTRNAAPKPSISPAATWQATASLHNSNYCGTAVADRIVFQPTSISFALLQMRDRRSDP